MQVSARQWRASCRTAAGRDRAGNRVAKLEMGMCKTLRSAGRASWTPGKGVAWLCDELWIMFDWRPGADESEQRLANVMGDRQVGQGPGR